MSDDPRVEILADWYPHEEKRGGEAIQWATRLLARLDTAAHRQPAPDENALPMEMLPEGWVFRFLVGSEGAPYRCRFVYPGKGMVTMDGPTPRAAFLAAIEAARHE